MAEQTPYIIVRVTEPTKQSDTFGSFINYKVTTSTNLAGFDFGEFSVVRRFNDFVWLAEQLAITCPGAIIPALPDKQIIGKFTQDFVESRRRSLERFITRVASHPQLVYSPRFVTFLQADDSALSAVKNEAKNEKKKNATNPIQWLESLTHNKTELEKTSADEKFEDITGYLTALEVQMEKVSKSASNMVKRDRQHATAMFEYGQALTWLGESESDSLGTGLCQVGSAVDQLSQAGTKHADDELVQLDEPMAEYVRLLHSLKEAIKRRADKKAQYINAIADLEAKQTAYSKVLGSAKEEVERAKQAAVEKASTACDTAKEVYERVTSELLDDFERFKAQKANDIRDILLNFVNLQTEHIRSSEEAWRNLIPTLQAISGGEAASAAEASLLQKHRAAAAAEASSSSAGNPFASAPPPPPSSQHYTDHSSGSGAPSGGVGYTEDEGDSVGV